MFIRLFFVLMTFSYPVYAYIDAGTGSMLIQGLVAILMFIPFYYRKIINFLKNKMKKQDKRDE